MIPDIHAHGTGPSGRETTHVAGAPILEVANLTIRYGTHKAIASVSFTLNKGDQVAVVGPNGAGKSTLFKAIAGVLPTSVGEIRIGGVDPEGHICIAYLPQRSQIDWTFPVTVEDVVMMGRIGRLGWFRRPRKEDKAFVRACLEDVRMHGHADRPIGALSGGEQQRMFIARALAQEAELMLMDEVMSACDSPSKEEIFAILETLKQRQVTILLSTHDLEEASTRFDQVMLLNQKLVGFGKATRVFTPDLLKEAYGGHLRLLPTVSGVMVLNDSCCGGGT